MTEEINVNELDDMAIKIKYVLSNKGRRRLEETLRTAEGTTNMLREAGRVPEYLLYQPMTI